MAAKVNPTAWGNAILELADAAADGSMPTALEQLGWVLEGSISIDVQEGDTLQLYETGHILRDEMKLEPTLSLNMTIIGIPDAMRAKFWEMDGTKVKSLVTSQKYAVKLYNPKIEGSDMLKAPFCSLSMSPAYADNQGYTATLAITLLKGQADYLFDMGKVEPIA